VSSQLRGDSTPAAVGKVEQDYLRRIVLRERDKPGGVAPALIGHTVRFVHSGLPRDLGRNSLQPKVRWDDPVARPIASRGDDVLLPRRQL